MSLHSFAAQEAEHPFISPDEIASGLQLAYPRLGLSGDGRWLAFITNKGEGFADLQTGKQFNTGDGWIMAGQSTWSPRDSVLALGVWREGGRTLALWSADKGGQDREVRNLLEFPNDLYPKLPPLWSADGKTLFMVIDQNLPWPKSNPADDNPPTLSPNVRLSVTGPYRRDMIRRPIEKEYPEAYAETNRSFVLAIDVSTGRVGMLAKGNDIGQLTLAPDGRRLAALQSKFQKPGRIADIYLIDIQDTARLPPIDLRQVDGRKAGWSDHAGRRLFPVLSEVSAWFTVWSPDSARFAYSATDPSRTAGMKVFVYDIAGRRTRDLTGNFSLPRSAKSLGHAEHYADYRERQFNPLLWLPDGTGLVTVGNGEAWMMSLDEQQPPLAITRDLPLETRWVLPSASRNIAAMDREGRLTLIAKERLSRLDSVWKVEPRSGASRKLADTGVWINTFPVTDAGEKQIFFVGQSEWSAMNVQRLSLEGESTPELFTRYKLELAQRAHPESRVLQWKTPDGYTGHGLLFLPAGASAGNKVPLIIGGDPGQGVSWLDVRAKTGVGFYSNDLHAMLKAGLAVLYPDIPMSDQGVYERPMKQVVDGVMAAADSAVATGVIDDKRMGLIGTGYGGFMVQAVLTRTARFRAAVSISGIADWYVDYLAGHGTDFHENGEGRMARPLWEDAARYVENSPLTYWNQVRTPLLLIHGEENSMVPIARAEESYNGLEYLGRTTIFARYNRMGAEPTVEANRRALGWFREHLLDRKPITHIADQGSFMFGGSDEDVSLKE